MSTPSNGLSLSDILADCGLTAEILGSDPPIDTVRHNLDKLGERVRQNGLTTSERLLLIAEAASELKEVGITGARGIVEAELKVKSETREDEAQGRALVLSDPQVLDEVPDGSVVADELARTFSRYVVLPPGGADTAALWTLHCHSFPAWTISPTLALVSPEKRFGKTTALEVLTYLAPRPLPASSITAAVVFRAVEKYQPTLIIDEADSFLHGADELRGILNSSHRKSLATSLRAVGEDNEVRAFRTWAPRAIALIGRLPDTLADRSVVLPMRRKKKGERVERLRLDRIADELEPLRRAAWTWGQANVETLREADPVVPDELHDRGADNWRPLLAIADLCGGDWPRRAREAARRFSGETDDEDSARVLLLGDLRELFEDRDVEQLASAEIVDELAKREDRPWPEWRDGKPLTKRGLAKLLAPFHVRPKPIWIGQKTRRGYERDSFTDLWERYLPPTQVQGPQGRIQDNDLRDSSNRKGVGSPYVSKTSEHPHNSATLADLTDRNPESWDYETQERAGMAEF